MARFELHKHPKANTKGFKQNPHNAGRSRSFANQLKDAIDEEGGIRFKPDAIKSYHPKTGVVIKIPTTDALVTRLISLAMSSDKKTSIKALEMIIDRIEGKPRQQLAFEQVVIPKKLPISLRPTELCKKCGQELDEEQRTFKTPIPET